MKTKEKKGLWWLTRVLTTIIIVGSILFYIAYKVFPEPGEGNPLTTKEIIGFCFVVIGFIGLLLAWKWEIPGAIISLIAYTALALIYPMILVPSPMYVWPVTAVLFIVLWKRRNINKEKLNQDIKPTLFIYRSEVVWLNIFDNVVTIKYDFALFGLGVFEKF